MPTNAAKFTIYPPIPNDVFMPPGNLSYEAENTFIKFIINASVVPNQSLICPIIMPCFFYFVNAGHPLPINMLSENATNNTLVIKPRPESAVILKHLFNANNKPAPKWFIYEDVRVSFFGNEPDANNDPELYSWYTSTGNEKPLNQLPAGVLVFPSENNYAFTLMILSEEKKYIDPIFFYRYMLKQYDPNNKQFDLAEFPHYISFVDSLPNLIEIEIRNEWNEPFSGEWKIKGPGDNIQIFNNESTHTISGVYGSYTIEFGDSYAITPYEGLSMSNTYRFEIRNDSIKREPIILQAINLNDWFVMEDFEEIYTKGNEVRFLVDGESYFRRVIELLDTDTDQIHYVFFTNWRMDYDFDLLPTRTRYGPSTNSIGSVLSDLGSKVFGLLWDQSRPDKSDFFYLKEAYCNDNEYVFLNRNIRYDNNLRFLRILLDHSPAPFSHHQKTLVIKKSDSFFAFCGGLDFAFQRWDNKNHEYYHNNRYLPQALTGYDIPALRNRIKEFAKRREHQKNWHDVHLEIVGPAARLIEKNFRERWDRAVMAQAADLITVIDSINRNSANTSSKEALPSLIGELPPSGQKFVKIARTYNSQNIYTIMQNLIHCIRRARRLIYIEDQYLISLNFAQELNTLLARSLELRVIVLTNRLPDHPKSITRRNRFVQTVDPSNEFTERFAVFHPIIYYQHEKNQKQVKNDIYVHSKMMIIDDIWIYVGSANLNNRGFTADTEIGAMIIDGQIERGCRKLALDMRRTLWEEHLGEKLSEASLLNYKTAISLWRSKIGIRLRDLERDTTLEESGIISGIADGQSEPWGPGENNRVPDPDNVDGGFSDMEG